MRFLLGFFLFFSQFVMCVVPPITIYVHGSQNATKWLSKDIWYCKQGLHHSSELSETSLFLSDAYLLQQENSDLFNLEHYYTFGWSGKVNFTVRKDAGHELYQAVKKLLKSYYEKYREYPAIRIITNSHGGNIALHMVEKLPFFEKEKIDLELIMLACPVQKTTEQLINHPNITRSYVLYSTFDLIQKLDCYKYDGHYYFPNRIFATKSANCKQVLVTVNGKRLAHTDFCHSIVRHIPEILSVADKTNVGLDRCMTYNITDPGFVFYNGFNISRAMKASRK